MEILDTIFGLILFSIILGLIADLVANSNAAKKSLRNSFDGTKRYMIERQDLR